MKKRVFGVLPSGTEIEEYTLSDGTAEASIITFGGAITRFVVDGIDVVLGFPTLEDYFEDHSHQGALIGRYGNRIAKGRFTGRLFGYSSVMQSFHRYAVQARYGGRIITDVIESIEFQALFSK